LFEHDLFGKPVSTFPDHALARALVRRTGQWPRLECRKDAPMNPADISASALPLSSSDLSLFHLFWQAHWLVKTVMLGLIICSVWVWAIAIDKTVLFRRIRKAADSFDQAFWSGQSLEELYTSLAAKPGHSTGALFVAAMREWKRSFEGHARSLSPLRARSSTWSAGSWCWRRSARRDPSSGCSARSGAS
jgi:hypothetical protein